MCSPVSDGCILGHHCRLGGLDAKNKRRWSEIVREALPFVFLLTCPHPANRRSELKQLR